VPPTLTLSHRWTYDTGTDRLDHSTGSRQSPDGADLFGPNSRTGAAHDVHSDFIMPLEQGEVAPMGNGTVVLFGDLQRRVIAGGSRGYDGALT
jgi:hypothetical protein